jgi:hypothetical protein
VEIKEYNLGDRVEMKKKHPCGSFEWEIIRLGADIKIKCLGCGHIVMLQRSKFNKQIKKVLTEDKVEQ